jgi:hypothetical protein
MLASLVAAQTAASPVEAVEAVAAIGTNVERANLTTELAQRAAVRMFETTNHTTGFVAALFEEATNYLVSRDLPGLVGTSPLLETVVSARRRKVAIRQSVRRTAEKAIERATAPKTPPEWKALVREICEKIRGS